MIGADDLQDRPSFYLVIFYVYDFYVFYYIWNMRLLLNIEQIAKELGLECWNESGFVNVRIGMADWDGTGIETDMVIKYYHGPYTDEWGHTAMKREEFQLITRQLFPGSISLNYIDNDDKLFSFLAGFILVKNDIGSWRKNYITAQYNREMEAMLAVLS